MAFSDLVKQNHNIFLQKQYDGVRANIEQKPHRASLSAILQFLFSMKLALAGLSNRSESLIWHFHLSDLFFLPPKL